MVPDEDFDGGSKLIEDYHKYTFRKILIVAVLIFITVIAAGSAMTIGVRDVSLLEAFDIVIKHLQGVTYEVATKEWMDDYTIWNLRIPRILGAIVVGVGLAIGGIAMQSITSNPLAEPYTTGMSSGAHLGVALALVLGFTLGTASGNYGLVINAFIFGMIPAIIVISITGFKRQSPATIILVGTAISYFFNSLSTIIVMKASPTVLQQIYLWQLGSLTKLGWEEVPLIAVVVLAGSILLMFLAKRLNLLSVGEESAKTLGLDVSTLRIVVLVILTVVTSVIVSFTGIIGFLGLVAPHIMRMIVGSDNKFVIPAAGMFGAALLLTADTIGRYLDEIPVGVVMAFIGSPLFLYLILKMKREVW